MRKEFSGSAGKTELVNILLATTGAGGTFDVVDGSTYPTGATAPFVVVINRGTVSEEKILCSSRTTNTFTISQRGYDGTTAVEHAATSPVHHTLDSVTVDEANAHANGNLTLHGSGAAVAGAVPQADGAGGIIWDVADGAGAVEYASVAPSDAPQAVKDRADYVCDGIDDEVQINAALTNSPAVMLLNGTFNIRGSVTIPGNNKVLVGQSHGAILRLVDGANVNVLNAVSYQDIYCGNFTIDGNGGMQTATCMGAALGGLRTTFDNLVIINAHYMGIQVVSGTRQFFIINCKVIVTYNFHGIGVYGETTSITEHGTIAFNYVERSSKGGIAIQAVAQNITMGYNHTKDTGEDGVTGYNSANRWIKITNNIMENPGNHGSHIGGNHYVFANNIVYNASFSGCYAYNNDGAVMYDTQIANNLFHITKTANAGMGVYARNVDNCSITTNVCVDPSAHGILVQLCNRYTVSGNTVRLANSGIRVQGSTRSAITGNNINGTSGPGIYLLSEGTTVHSFYNTITGNQISDAAGNMIIEAANSDYNIISSNVGEGNTNPIATNGVNTIVVNNINAPGVA